MEGLPIPITSFSYAVHYSKSSFLFPLPFQNQSKAFKVPCINLKSFTLERHIPPKIIQLVNF